MTLMVLYQKYPVIPDKGSEADCCSGIQREGGAKPHKMIPDPVCANIPKGICQRDDAFYNYE